MVHEFNEQLSFPCSQTTGAVDQPLDAACSFVQHGVSWLTDVQGIFHACPRNLLRLSQHATVDILWHARVTITKFLTKSLSFLQCVGQATQGPRTTSSICGCSVRRCRCSQDSLGYELRLKQIINATEDSFDFGHHYCFPWSFRTCVKCVKNGWPDGTR